jgi:dynein heavy chain
MQVNCARLLQTVRMNALLEEMRRSMEELQLGLDGALNMSDKMEALAKGIATNKVPALWMSCMSTRVQEVFSLSAWYHDVLKRYEQLAAWTAGPIAAPHSVWLSGLFNPKAFLTAVSFLPLTAVALHVVLCMLYCCSASHVCFYEAH